MFKRNSSYDVQSQEMANKPNTGRRGSENPSRINLTNESFNKLKEHFKRRSIADFNSVQCRFYTDMDAEIEINHSKDCFLIKEKKNCWRRHFILFFGGQMCYGGFSFVAVKSKETGSMEDLSASPEERQNKIKAKLKKFFNRRPTVDSLKKKGIYKGKMLFALFIIISCYQLSVRFPLWKKKHVFACYGCLWISIMASKSFRV